MYQPKKYQKKDSNYIYTFIQHHPFATLVLKGERLLATHIPVLVEGDAENLRLYSHIANHNEQIQHLTDGTEVLLIFQGAHGYVSSSWYREKDISTWDYSAVHVNARIKIQSTEELEQSLVNLVHKFEKDQEKPLWYKDIPSEIISDHLPLITGFWCEPFKIEGIAKLHQGYDSENLNRISKKLQERDDPMDSVLEKNIKAENDTKDR
ncbi:MAG: FMN-binding negative transcriptional regulator [Salegentibacter sp.]|uniref:Negative transcriptional regulator, PaiB family n=1 Tax=Salegentibacter flavus TaxID=287099 RepID=A0A1I4XP82_9FLAO|nr:MULTISPECIES: FMN-binding negative transcriptional regulator [Salegentibacter]MDR9456363.1 FMN-binding negative transcriptional regulator [Salegentibacter sp.]SFN27651.1 negative transcriptional regulator, PaiB family [Salegentibacter flavus]